MIRSLQHHASTHRTADHHQNRFNLSVTQSPNLASHRRFGKSAQQFRPQTLTTPPLRALAASNDHVNALNGEKVIVVLGGSRGIGQGLVDAFLRKNHKVIFTGQSQQSVEKSIQHMKRDHASNNLKGYTCDIRNLKDIETVWDHAASTYGRVDHWITCAGVTQSPRDKGSLRRLVDMRAECLSDVIDINLTGAIHTASVVIPRMEQQGHGHFYLFEGFGSDGTIRTGFAAYGASKVGIQYLKKALAKENEESRSPVKICSLAPGIVATDLLRDAYDKNSPEWKKDREIYKILADNVEPVADFLASEVLKEPKNGQTISWLTPLKAITRFATAPFVKRPDLNLGDGPTY